MLLSMEFEGLPPTVNHMYRTRGRYRYKTAETREYQEAITEQIRRKWKWKNRPTYTGRAALTIIFFTNNHKRWDIDNRVKGLQDCLSMAGVIKDDTQIDELHVSRMYVPKGGKDKTSLKLYEVIPQ